MRNRITKPAPKDIPAEICRQYIEQYHPDVYHDYRKFLEDSGESLEPADKRIILGGLLVLNCGAFACFYSPIPWLETAGMLCASVLSLMMAIVWLTPSRERATTQMDAFIRYNQLARSVNQQIAQRVYEMMLEIKAGLTNTPNPQTLLKNLCEDKNEVERSIAYLALKLLNE